MIAKYHVDYGIPFRKRIANNVFTTDDPVACEEFLLELLERGLTIQSIKHEGVALSQADFDKMVKTAAGMLAARHLCRSLGIKAEEERFRFGFSA